MFSPAVFNVINEEIKAVKKEKKEYFAKTHWTQTGNGDLTPHQCFAKLEALNNLKKALRKAGIRG